MHIMNGIRAGRFLSEWGICQLISQPYYSLNGWTTDEKRIWAAFKGVHLSPLGFAACQSKKCTNRARSAPTKQEDGLNGFLLLGKN